MRTIFILLVLPMVASAISNEDLCAIKVLASIAPKLNASADSFSSEMLALKFKKAEERLVRERPYDEKARLRLYKQKERELVSERFKINPGFCKKAEAVSELGYQLKANVQQYKDCLAGYNDLPEDKAALAESKKDVYDLYDGFKARNTCGKHMLEELLDLRKMFIDTSSSPKVVCEALVRLLSENYEKCAVESQEMKSDK